MHWFFHWVWVVIVIVAAVSGFLQLPTAVAQFFRFLIAVQNWWSSFSRRRTVKRLAELETVLKKLDCPFPIEERQAQFYNAMFVIMYAVAAGLMVNTASFANLPPLGFTHEKLAVIALAFFLLAIGVAGWGMFRFRLLLPQLREMRRREIEQAIKTLRDALAKFDERP